MLGEWRNKVMSNHKARNARGLGRPVQKTLAAAVALLLLAGCATTTAPDYRPRLPGGQVGYSDLQLSPNRYRVSFSGSTASTRDDVERYLLRRAAEVTLQTGHTAFMLANRDTERDTYYGGYPGDFYYGGPYYPYPYRSFYGYGYDPYWGANGWSANTYSAYADVMMFNADEAARNPQAIDALSLLQRLQPPLPVASAANER
jgi:hypothetical protein